MAFFPELQKTLIVVIRQIISQVMQLGLFSIKIHFSFVRDFQVQAVYSSMFLYHFSIFLLQALWISSIAVSGLNLGFWKIVFTPSFKKIQRNLNGICSSSQIISIFVWRNGHATILSFSVLILDLGLFLGLCFGDLIEIMLWEVAIQFLESHIH